MSTIRHVAGEMDDQIQRCVICGYEITNYQGAVWIGGDGPPKGFATGDVYVTEYGGSREVSKFPPEDGHIEDCKP